MQHANDISGYALYNHAQAVSLARAHRQRTDHGQIVPLMATVMAQSMTDGEPGYTTIKTEGFFERSQHKSTAGYDIVAAGNVLGGLTGELLPFVLSRAASSAHSTGIVMLDYPKKDRLSPISDRGMDMHVRAAMPGAKLIETGTFKTWADSPVWVWSPDPRVQAWAVAVLENTLRTYAGLYSRGT